MGFMPSPRIDLKRVRRFRKTRSVRLPLFLSSISAGFPSPAEDHIDKSIDLNEHLVQHPAATFFIRVKGDSMTDAGIQNGDLLVVDRAMEPADNKIVIAVVDGELTVKRLRKRGKKVTLEAANPKFSPIEITDQMEAVVWGVVTNVIHKV